MKRVSPSFQVISKKVCSKEPAGKCLNEEVMKCMMPGLPKYDPENGRESMVMVKYSEEYQPKYLSLCLLCQHLTTWNVPRSPTQSSPQCSSTHTENLAKPLTMHLKRLITWFVPNLSWDCSSWHTLLKSHGNVFDSESFTD